MDSLIQKILLVLLFAFLGYFSGCAISSGNETYMNKSERKIHQSMGLPIISGVVGAIIGIVIVFSAFEEDKRNKELGIHQSTFEEFKKGRGWVHRTTWSNPVTGINNVVLTDKHDSGELVTFFNGDVFFRHGVTSAAKKLVSEKHSSTVGLIYKKLRSGEVSQL